MRKIILFAALSGMVTVLRKRSNAKLKATSVANAGERPWPQDDSVPLEHAPYTETGR